MREKTYTTFQVAAICGVYPSTVINWIKGGKLAAFRTPGGHRRVLERDMVAFLKEYDFPIPEGMELGKRRVLIVEDDPDLGPMLLKSLKRLSDRIQTRLIDNGVEALVALGKEPPDLMILDVHMENVDGARVLATLRSDPATAGIRVVGITGKRLPPEKLKFMQKNTDAFFIKPFDPVQFEESLLRLLRAPAKKYSKVSAK